MLRKKGRGPCQFPGCEVKRPSFNYKGLKNGIFCKDHKLIKMFNVTKKLCAYDECEITPVFNEPNKKSGLYCEEHKKEGMENVTDPLCIEEGCTTRASFPGELDAKKKLYCGAHKKIDKINPYSKKCVVDGCGTTALFNRKNELTPLYCKQHSLEYCEEDKFNPKKNINNIKNIDDIKNIDNIDDIKNIVDVKHKKCDFFGCDIRPSFYDKDDLKKSYCFEHKPKNYIKNKRGDNCIIDGCTTRASYGNEYKKPLYCKKHSNGCENVVSPRCIFEGCKSITPCFNLKGEKPLYCKTHASKDMIDVKHKLCEFNGCEKRADHNFHGKASKFCKLHKLNSMVKDPLKKCDKCNDLAIYGFKTHTHCEKHQENGMKNIIEEKCEKCVSCGLSELLNENNLCISCRPNIPNIRLEKQNKIKQFLDSQNIIYESCDKIYDIQCGKERPDFIISSLNGLYKIILEVDENQHKSYEETCECVRMVNIYNQMEGQKVIFIRYNPDDFKTKGKKINISEVKRLNILSQYLTNYILKNDEEIMGMYNLSVIKLFFDEWEESNNNLTEIPTN